MRPLRRDYLIFLLETARTAVQRILGNTTKMLGADTFNVRVIRLDPTSNSQISCLNRIPKSLPCTNLLIADTRLYDVSDVSAVSNNTVKPIIDTTCRTKSTMQIVNAAFTTACFFFPKNAANKHRHGITSARRYRTEN